MVLEIIQVQAPSGFQFLDIFFCISNNNSRSRNAKVKYSINRLFLSTRRTSLQLHIWSISNDTQNNSSTRSQRVSIPRHPFVISATITRDLEMLEWNTLLIDCSSHQGEHFWNWHIWSFSNGSRNNSSTRSQRVSIPRHPFVISATITRDPCMLEWNTLLIDCSSLEANIFAIDIYDLFLMVLGIIQVQCRSGFPFLDIFLFYQLQYLEMHECLSETLY